MKLNRRKFLAGTMLAAVTAVVTGPKVPKTVKFGDGGVVADHATSGTEYLEGNEEELYYGGAQWDRPMVRKAQAARSEYFRKLIDEAAFNMMTGGKS